MRYEKEDVFRAARAIRSELPRLVGETAPRILSRLDELLARHDEDSADAIVELLSTQDSTRRWFYARLRRDAIEDEAAAAPVTKPDSEEKYAPPAAAPSPAPATSERTTIERQGAAKTTGAELREPRHLNIALANRWRRPRAKSRALSPKRRYLIRIDIGVPDPDRSLVENPVAFPIDRLDPSSPEGYWLEVFVVSRDIDVDAAVRRIFLPFVGPSWVCRCRTEKHTCTRWSRSRYLYLSIRTMEANSDATLRCTVYHRNNAVQSAEIHLTVASRKADPAAHRALIDYTLAPEFLGMESLSPRSINVLTNETPDGSHRIVVKDGDQAIPVDLTEAATGDILTAVRSELRRVSLGADGTVSRYDADNRKPTEEFIADLKALALLGSTFWGAVVPRFADRESLSAKLQRRATIQVSRLAKTVFPWALVYDIPRELQANWTLCPLLSDWEDERERLDSYPGACPHDSKHHLNVLCPFGFWGFKHIVEQPASVRQGVLKTSIPVSDGSQLVLARSLELDPELAELHLGKLGQSLGSGFRISRCDSRDALREALADPVLPLIYFYCHGKWGVLGESNLRVPFLEIGREDKIGPNDFAAWGQDGAWGAEHWHDVSPLVVINGCHTAELSPEGIVSFVESLAGMNVAGVVGTEISVSQQVAGEMAERFFSHLTGSTGQTTAQTVGVALHRARIDMLQKGNVTGLIYTPFCSMDLAFSMGPRVRRG